MLDGETRESLSFPSPGGGDGEGWLVSYLDVLTLLITLFVLMLSLSSNELGGQHAEADQRAISAAAKASALAIAAGISPLNAGLQPRSHGLQPRFKGLEINGVSVAQGDRGITLRIDNNLLFASGQAALTAGGKQVLQELVETLQAFDGQISVEGHTDNVPIHTVQFPSNWELSTGRAISVLRYLAASGVPEARLRAIGYADTRPLAGNETAQDRATNRRVEILLTQKN